MPTSYDKRMDSFLFFSFNFLKEDILWAFIRLWQFIGRIKIIKNSI